ncbi:PREDICTED: sulfotransferase 4A1-like [Wasmannia auropunctata]|uniref:sulfotransferase 4A1-like n=1 Tax=Wasmannia auropunctata TaxID=64793 RepID=UPI0005EDFFFC|nr:PREDICTED: sulfotransferase 4A1-like [Wasmannia auropunctata]
MVFKDLRVERVENELGDALFKLYPNITNGFVKIGEKKWHLPYKYVDIINATYNFEVRQNDTWIVTYPRSGTTITQELIWLVANDMNFEQAHQRPLTHRFPYICSNAMDALDVASCSSNVHKIIKSDLEFVQNQTSPRFIKTHLPFDLLPTVKNSDCKIIYVARNPRDMVISIILSYSIILFNFHKNLTLYNYQGTFEQFCDLFLNNHMTWSPYWEHVKEAWAMRHRTNLLFLFYEDLIKDLPGNIKKVAEFFGKVYSDEQIVKLAEHLKIENFRENPMVNINSIKGFIRQGKIGNWKELFTAEIEEKFSKWISDNLKDTNLTFPV